MLFADSVAQSCLREDASHRHMWGARAPSHPCASSTRSQSCIFVPRNAPAQRNGAHVFPHTLHNNHTKRTHTWPHQQRTHPRARVYFGSVHTPAGLQCARLLPQDWKGSPLASVPNSPDSSRKLPKTTHDSHRRACPRSTAIHSCRKPRASPRAEVRTSQAPIASVVNANKHVVVVVGWRSPPAGNPARPRGG
jgi:hypothetical protein